MTHIKSTQRRHFHIRKTIVGAAQKPRLNIHKSLKNLTAQLVDDLKGVTLLGMSTQSEVFKAKGVSGGSVKGAVVFGEVFTEEAIKKGISKVVFDRGGYLYHGRIKAFADACRKKGLIF